MKRPVAWLIVLAACTNEPVTIGWLFDLQGIDAERIATTRIRIRKGGCGGEVLHETAFTNAMTGRPSMALAPGTYGFDVQVIDRVCAQIGSSCVERTLPLAEPGVLRITVNGHPPENACPGDQQCQDGVCQSTPDAGLKDVQGPSDASPVLDASGTDASQVDIGTPALVAPANGAITGQQPILRWSEAPGASSYRVQGTYQCDPTGFQGCTFDAPTLDTQTADTLSNAGIALPGRGGRRFFWRVQGCDDGTTCGDFSAVRYFHRSAAPGDFDNDGESDIAAGAPGWSPGGRVYIFDGSQVPRIAAGTSAPTAWGGSPGGTAGGRVAYAGDTDADGFGDLLYQGGAGARVSLVAGSTTGLGDELADLGVMTASVGLAGLGDINGDGYADFAVRDPPARRVSVFSGGSPDQPAAHLDTGSASAGDRFGDAISGGDFDADGFGDIAVGAPGVSNDRGAVTIFWGEPGFEFHSRSALTLPPAIASGTAQFGHALASGDVNGDGVADLAVGAPFSADGLVAVYVVVAPNRTLQRIDLTRPGSGAGAQFGFAVAAGVDFNGDDVPDLAVGAPFAATGSEPTTGGVWVFFGAAAPMSAPLSQWAFFKPQSRDTRFGTSVALLHITSMPALVVGAPDAFNGEVTVWPMGAMVPAHTLAVGEQTQLRLGTSLAVAP